MKNRMIALAALLAVLPGPLSLRAQSTPPAQSKIGVIDMQTAIASTAEGKKVIADLSKKYQPRQQELVRLQQEIQGIQDQLTKQAATLSDEEQGRLSRDAEEKQKLYKRSAEDAQNDFNRDRDEAVNRIVKKMVQVIHDYAQQNGFTLVIDRVQVNVYFVAQGIELTEEIVKRYDAANPVADAGAPVKPATHPATPAPTPTPKPK